MGRYLATGHLPAGEMAFPNLAPPKIAGICLIITTYFKPHSPDHGHFCCTNLMFINNYHNAGVSKWYRLDSAESVYSFIMEDL